MVKPNPSLKIRQHITNLAPYTLSDTSGPAGKTLLQLSQNENFFGVSPQVTTAIEQAHPNIHLYSDPETTSLREAIADVYHLDPSKVLCSAGSMALISLLATLFCEPGSSVVTTRYGYLFFRTAVTIARGEIIIVDEPDLTVDIETILAAIRPDTRLVFVVNPGNPTGTYLPNQAIRELRAQLASDILLVVDEAYGEYVTTPDEPLFDLVEQENTVILRTFSKIYGLAGLRVGWGYVPPALINYMQRIQLPNTIANLSAAAAVAAVEDQAHVAFVRQATAKVRDTFSAEIKAMDLTPIPSQTNFVLGQFPSVEAAQAALAYLRDEGIIVRAMGGYGLSDCLRITLGPPDQMERVVEVLRGC